MKLKEAYQVADLLVHACGGPGEQSDVLIEEGGVHIDALVLHRTALL